jgi:hypothetical protein
LSKLNPIFASLNKICPALKDSSPFDLSLRKDFAIFPGENYKQGKIQDPNISQQRVNEN